MAGFAVAPIHCRTSPSQLVKRLPVVIIWILFAWAYFGSVAVCIIHYTWLTRHDGWTATWRAAVFHALWIASVSSYVLTMKNGAGPVLAHPPRSQDFEELSKLPSRTVHNRGLGRPSSSSSVETIVPLLSSYDQAPYQSKSKPKHVHSVLPLHKDDLDERDVREGEEEEGMELLDALTLKTENENEHWDDGTVREECVMVKSDGTGRFCKKCQVPKPDRAHHCSICNRCFLKHDHHCPWTGGCVGLYNYKQFLLFIFYSSFMCAFACYLGTITLIDYIDNVSSADLGEFFPILCAFLALSGGSVGATVGGFTMYHISLLLRNLTTIEAMERSNPFRVKLPTLNEEEYPPWAFKADHMLTRAEREALISAGEKWRVYDLGWRRNWVQVLGRDWRIWFLPVNRIRPWEGYKFPINEANLERLQKVTKEIRLNEPSPTLSFASRSSHSHSRSASFA